FQQQRIWLLDQLEPENSVYHQIAAVRFKGALNEPALQASLDDIVRRHEVLRTVFPSQDGTPMQRILDPSTCQLNRLELKTKSSKETEEQIRAIALEQKQRPFDLAKEPVSR